MLVSCSTFRNACNAPGWSSSGTSNAYLRCCRVSPRSIKRLIMLTSIFPPEQSRQMRLCVGEIFPAINAAVGTAPAPSVMIWCFSRRNKKALWISASSTVTSSSTYFCTSSNVRWPGSRTWIPSAIVFALGSVMRFQPSHSLQYSVRRQLARQ